MKRKQMLTEGYVPRRTGAVNASWKRLQIWFHSEYHVYEDGGFTCQHKIGNAYDPFACS